MMDVSHGSGYEYVWRCIVYYLVCIHCILVRTSESMPCPLLNVELHRGVRTCDPQHDVVKCHRHNSNQSPRARH